MQPNTRPQSHEVIFSFSVTRLEFDSNRFPVKCRHFQNLQRSAQTQRHANDAGISEF